LSKFKNTISEDLPRVIVVLPVEWVKDQIGFVFLQLPYESFDSMRLVSVILIKVRNEIACRTLERKVGCVSTRYHPPVASRARIRTARVQVEELEPPITKPGDNNIGVIIAAIANDDNFEILVRLLRHGSQRPIGEDHRAIRRCYANTDKRVVFAKN